MLPSVGLGEARPREMARRGDQPGRRDLDSAPIGARPPTDRVGSAHTHGHRPTPPRASTVASVRVPRGHLVPPCHALARPPERWSRFLTPHPRHERPNAPAVSTPRFAFAGGGDQLVACPNCRCGKVVTPGRAKKARAGPRVVKTTPVFTQYKCERGRNHQGKLVGCRHEFVVMRAPLVGGPSTPASSLLQPTAVEAGATPAAGDPAAGVVDDSIPMDINDGDDDDRNDDVHDDDDLDGSYGAGEATGPAPAISNVSDGLTPESEATIAATDTSDAAMDSADVHTTDAVHAAAAAAAAAATSAAAAVAAATEPPAGDHLVQRPCSASHPTPLTPVQVQPLAHLVRATVAAGATNSLLPLLARDPPQFPRRALEALPLAVADACRAVEASLRSDRPQSDALDPTAPSTELVPSAINAFGACWLVLQWQGGVSVALADAMGKGKTHTVLAALALWTELPTRRARGASGFVGSCRPTRQWTRGGTCAGAATWPTAAQPSQSLPTWRARPWRLRVATASSARSESGRRLSSSPAGFRVAARGAAPQLARRRHGAPHHPPVPRGNERLTTASPTWGCR